MTPHSVGGSLNELGEARGTVLAVKLDRQEKGRKNHQLGRQICKVIHFPKHHFWVSYGIYVDFGDCSRLWPFQMFFIWWVTSNNQVGSLWISAYSHQNLQIGFVWFYLASWFMYNTTEQESARTVGIFLLQIASNSYPFTEDSPFESIWDDWNTFEISPTFTLNTTLFPTYSLYPPNNWHDALGTNSFPTAPWGGSILAGM